MIKRIELNNIATYNHSVIVPKKINFIYGGNGTGKTSISNFLANVNEFPTCKIENDNYPTDILVYNKNFVEENFGKDKAIKGIFTIGEENKEVEDKIKELISQKEDIEKNKTIRINKIDEFTQNAELLYAEFCNNCWTMKKVAEPYKKAMIGVLNSKEAFAEMCLKHFTNTKSSIELTSFNDRYKMLHETVMQSYPSFDLLEIETIFNLETHNILSTNIVAKEDNPLSTIIKKLNNSDWIKLGTSYLKETHNTCPFCQRELPKEIILNLENLFDEEYEKNINTLNSVYSNYKSASSLIVDTLKSIIASNITILDYQAINKLFIKVESLFNDNLKILAEKIRFPSNKIDLNKTNELLIEINNIIKEFNSIIKQNNEILTKQIQEKTKLSKEIWETLSNNYLFDVISEYKKKQNGINIATHKMMMERDVFIQDISKIETKINELQSKVSTIDKAINEINKILKGFAFTGFYLRKAHDNRNYEIIREDGSNAKDTLSEGEERFITFLYFIQLINGNVENKRTINKKIVVIDDPISSLDSNILFIVSSLIKEIINDCKSGANLIDQIFVLTHNIYFHHQISFRPKSNQLSPDLVTYVTINKKDNISSIKQSNKNSIQTSYELLWQEIKNPENSSRANIFNSMRRILEYYFDIIGGLDYDELINSFSGEDKLICNSLISFVNANSHSIADDFVIGFSEEDIEKYLIVFKKIFTNSHHEAHYNMMMSRDY